MTSKKTLKAKPETEDFAHKYTEEGQGKIGSKLIDGYFNAVQDLVSESGVSGRKKIEAIEIGCGEGFSTARLSELLPANVTLQASEYVKELVPKARKNNPGIKVTQESVYETKHKDNQFDLVFLLEVLEHLDYPEEALAEIARIIKPGGFLILGVPREPLWCTLNLARGKYIKHFGNTPGHFNHWSTYTLQKYIKSNFGPIQAKKTPLPWTIVLAQTARNK